MLHVQIARSENPSLVRKLASLPEESSAVEKSLLKDMEPNKGQESPVEDSKSYVPSLVNRFLHLPVNSSNKGYGVQRSTRSLLTEHDSPKCNKIPDNKRKETLSPGLERGSNDVPKGKTNMDNYESLEVFQMPVCLIETDSDGKMQVHKNVLDQIGHIDHPLNIVCIAGPYRTGKSYLLNRLAGINKGFALGSTIQSKTKGIWVWCRPHPVKKDQVLLLMDTEGLSDIEKGDTNNDNQILALGILLSSTMVYNILSKFGKDDLEKLSFVTEISKNIKFSDKMGIEESSRNFDRVFPTFILTLRDFTLEMEHEGKPITSDEYFENVCLKLHPDISQTNRENNRAPLCLMEYFKTRKCFTFDIPGGRKILCKLEDVQDNELSRDFITETKLFIDYVYNECSPKQMNNGHPVNGRRFIILAEQYVDAIRNGKVPNVVDALATMIHTENWRAIEESVRIYVSGMNKLQYPTPDIRTLSAAHERCLDDALEFFWGNSMYDEAGNYYNIANSQITKEYENFRTRDQEESTKKSQVALKGMDSMIKQKTADGLYLCKDGYNLYLKDVKKLETDYCALTGLGCKKEAMLNEYHRDTASRGEIIMQADATLTKKEKEIEGEKQKSAEAKRREKADKRLLKVQKILHEEEDLRNKKAYKQMKEKYEKELQNERDHLEKVLEQRHEELKRLEKEGLLTEVERVKSNMEQVQTELHEYKNETGESLLSRGVAKLFKSLKFW